MASLVFGRMHLIGCGGVGMAALAEALVDHGVSVTGSEVEDRPALPRLRELGCDVFRSHRAEHVRRADTVVYSTAVPHDNVELLEARRRGLAVVHRSTVLAELTRNRRAIAVAGTHGKTSTTSMLVTALTSAGSDPGFVLGGHLAGFGGGHRGTAPEFVFEADESDRSFLVYHPFATIITNIDSDHLNVYGNMDTLKAEFGAFARLVDPRGFVVMSADDRHSLDVVEKLRGDGVRVVTFGESRGADLLIGSIVESPDSVSFMVPGCQRVRLPVPGRHMAANAAAALLAATELGLSLAQATTRLGEYPGVARRFELKGAVGGVLVYDDYACHHTSIEASLRTLRTTADRGRLVAVVEPCRQYRVREFRREIAQALGVADVVAVLPVFGDGDAERSCLESAKLTDAIPLPARDKFFVGTVGEAVRGVVERVAPGDVVATLGAPGMARVAEGIVDALTAKPPEVR